MKRDVTGDGIPAGAPNDAEDVEAIAAELIDQPRKLAKPFARQDFAVRSITVLGTKNGRPYSAAAVVLRVDGARLYRVSERPVNVQGEQPLQFDVPSVHRLVEETCGRATGADLIAASAEILGNMAISAGAGSPFQAVIAVGKRIAAPGPEKADQTLRRSLFDNGFVGVGSVDLPRRTLAVFLASDAVRAPEFLHTGERGQITMSSLGRNGRFGNQLFQYAFMKLYALRHGAKMAVPDWQGRKLFGLKDPSDKRIRLPELAFQGFSQDDLALWDVADPAVNVDFWGYFQEIPACWLPHRRLLKTLFGLPPRKSKSIDTWCSALTDNGRRTLVAVHVRRTDYSLSDMPWFETIPEQWYLEWLRDIWPKLANPVLYVATDDPGTVLAHFAEFAPKSLVDLPRSRLPEYVRDFEMLRRAEYVAICNSSFSRMAAILAREDQRCFLPSFDERAMLPYQPWSDGLFWPRFEGIMSDPRTFGEIKTMAEARSARASPEGAKTIYLDVTDLLFHLRSHGAISGIQRVQCELIRNLHQHTQGARVNFTVFNETGLCVVRETALLGILDRIQPGSRALEQLQNEIKTVLQEVIPATVRAGDVFLTTGAFWVVSSVGRLVGKLKDSGMTIGVFVHDILPISRPEFFEANAGNALVRPVVEVLALADFVITSSNYNKGAVAAHRAQRNLASIPIHVVPLGHGLPVAMVDTGETGDLVADKVKPPFVLCVGTIEVRKNPSYLFNIWKLMVEAGRDAIPKLVLAGRKGWLVDDFLGQLKASNNLDGRIVLMHDLSDQALEVLYRHCLLTVFPSFDEGWGLPVGESLVHGKICLASQAGGIPEVGATFADYIDPYNVRDGYDRLVHYLDDPERRKSREAEIAMQFPLRTWQEYAAEMMLSVKANLAHSPTVSGPSAVSLPANEFLPIGSRIEGSSKDALRGALSAESACISGWRNVETIGIAPAGPSAVLRFRAGPNTGAKVTMILRFSGSGSKPCAIDIRAQTGSPQRVTIRPGAEVTATLACESDQDGLVTVFFEAAGSGKAAPANRSSWKLKGFLYIQPAGLAAGPSIAPASSLGKPLDATALPMPPNASGSAGHPTPSGRIKAAYAKAQGDIVNSLSEFLHVPNSRWRNAADVTLYRHEPIFLDAHDRTLFQTRYRNHKTARLGAVCDDITFRRFADQYVSMSRFSEGAVFDRSGFAKDLGYAEADAEDRPWLTSDRTGTWIRAEALDEAPHLDGTFAVFYNGNLHNYYHWVAEGLLALDVLTDVFGDGLDLRLVLPQTMDINAVLDHRTSLTAMGFDKWPVVDAPPHLVHVDEAIWLESADFIEGVPAAQVKKFQRRIASLYAGRRGPRGKRLLVKRLGPARAISNFEEVEAFLHPLGFETVWLDGSSVEEQILLFQRAEFVVSAHGAGLTNLLFCEAGTKVIEFMPMVEMRPFFWLISEKLGLRHAMQFCPGVEGTGFQASLRVDIERLRALFELVDSDR